ncbi:MAG: ATPase, T2SS/T4P/T4SS family, partial [Pseudomonadota bacterium]
CLDKLNTGNNKILTVEDPVEYQQPGIQQIQVHSGIGLTFAAALRSVLRHDPDILMVGEIRDLETAEIAIQFALTGHPVLSTLHTNSAAASVTRLLDMGVDDYLLTSAINGIVAQRLVRRLCVHCKKPAPETAEIAERLGQGGFENATFYKADGCSECRQTGYSGRSAIVEVLPFTRSVTAAILDGKSAQEIQEIAVADGMVTLLQDGLKRAAAGETTLEEVLRVARLAK